MSDFSIGGVPLDDIHAVQLEMLEEIDRICEINIVTGEVIQSLSYVGIYPATHYAVSEAKKETKANKVFRVSLAWASPRSKRPLRTA